MNQQTTTLHHRYIYRGYLQIAALDLTRSAHPNLWLVTWDPSQPTATRPLAINITGDGLYFPTVDLTKNVCELIDAYGDIVATYDYAPFGAVTAGTPSGLAVPANPLQWSSEVYDSELDLVYYNYRHYSPSLGRFLSRDPIEEQGGWNLYAFVCNKSTALWDVLGKWTGVSPGTFFPPATQIHIGNEIYKYTHPQVFSVSEPSLLSKVKAVLPGTVGSVTLLSLPCLTIPYPPNGAFSVGLSGIGAIEECCDTKIKAKKLQFNGTVSLSGEAAAGPGIGKTPGKKLPEKPSPKPIDNVSLSKERRLPLCETNFSGSITVEIGARAGAIVYGEVFANYTFLTTDPIKFNYGIRSGVSSFVGGALYLNATINAGGTIRL